jgi:hypothetical protein
MSHPDSTPSPAEQRNESQSSGATTLAYPEPTLPTPSDASSRIGFPTPHVASSSSPQQHADEIEMLTITRSQSHNAHPGQLIASRDVHPGYPTQQPDVVPLQPSKSHPQAKFHNRVSLSRLVGSISVEKLRSQIPCPSNLLTFILTY